MLKYLWKNKLLILLLILIVTMCPTTISLPEQSRTEAIITAVGVDKKDDEFEITIQYIMPQSSEGQENLKTTSGKGKSVGEVFENLNLELGKKLGFAHCRFLAFNEEAGKDNLTKILDYLLRQKTNTNNIVLINTKESASDLISTAKSIDSDLYTFLSNSGYSNELKEYNDLTVIGDFYKSYFGINKSMCVYIVDTKDASSGGSSGGGGGGSESNSKLQSQSEGGGGGGSSGGEEKEISNEERIMIIKDAKILIGLTAEESHNLVWFNEKVKRLQFEVKGFKDDRIGEVDTMVNIFKRNVKKEVYFDDNGVPHYKLKTKNYVRVSQLISDSLEQKDYGSSENRFDSEFEKYVKEICIKKLKSIEEHFKTNNYDVIDCYELFHKFKTKQLNEYLKTHSKDDFIKDVVFEYEINFVQGS